MWISNAAHTLTAAHTTAASPPSSHRAPRQALDLSSNGHMGGCPDSWSALTDLQHLALSDNALQGTLPPSWSTLINLVVGGLSVVRHVSDVCCID